jgi:hypothetical protein
MSEPTRRFETERTRRFRQGDLNEEDECTIANVETFGCSVVHVKQCTGGLGWTFTVGVFDTCGKPEVITVGLRQETAHFLLNEAARRLRSGINLAEGRHREMVGEVECEFRPVDPRWVRHLMGWAMWYYGGADFPVLQAVYPDLDNRFPEESGFDEAFRRPLLQPDAAQTILERDFWASADPGSSLFDWRFPDPPDTPAFLSEAVLTGAEPVTFVSHDIEDGAWQFLGESMADDTNPVVCCLYHPLETDPSLRELADLPLGWWAKRAGPGEPWIRHQGEPEGKE